MISEISDILARFERCFTRRAAFSWFVVIIFGLLVRLDQHGIASLTRWLGLEPRLYLSCLNFFRTSSWTLADLQLCWSKIVKEQFPMITIGDGIKVSKEAKKMPGVKNLHQDSAITMEYWASWLVRRKNSFACQWPPRSTRACKRSKSSRALMIPNHPVKQ